MNMQLFLALMVCTLGIFIVPKQWKGHLSLILQIGVAIVTGSFLLPAILAGEGATIPFIHAFGQDIPFHVDALSAFFGMVVNLTALTGGIYALGYMKPYLSDKSSAQFGLHYFSFLWLHISMLLVCLIDNGIGFMVAWEIMSVSSFFLVVFESEKSDTVHIGLKYLIQMHIGLLLIMLGFIISSYGVDGMGFSALEAYFNDHSVWPVFLLFFLGFGIKAGFMPLHTWLPHAHPAAPSHVSGVMSGVMIKMGIYGVLRVLTHVHSDLLGIGLFILAMSLSSGLLGVMYAIVQHDLKKLLAYHSIENIGIIGIGIGIGIVGLALHIPALAALGFAGGILHVLNHSLFKSLLFYTAGSVYQQTHTREIEKLGGLIRKMPVTAVFFLLGALAISGLPPFNGFISEFLIYLGLYKGLLTSQFSSAVIILVTFIGLALIGGLAIFCFTKVFSIVFLGTARSTKVDHAKEVDKSMLLSYTIASLFIVGIGAVPMYFANVAGQVGQLFVTDMAPLSQGVPSLISISLTSGIFILLITALLILRRTQQKKVEVQRGPTWGCGYTGADPALHQYTATSYADQYQDLTAPVLNRHKHYHPIEEAEIFPQPRTFESHTSDIIEDRLIDPPSGFVVKLAEMVAIFQTGKLQHYVLYGFLFMALIFSLTLFNLI